MILFFLESGTDFPVIPMNYLLLWEINPERVHSEVTSPAFVRLERIG